MILRKSFIYFMLIWFLSPVYGQVGLNQKIDAIYAPYSDTPGAMVGVWKDGEVLFAKAYGLANLEHQVAFSTATTSDIGSVAKQLTCYAILLLEQDGQLSLKDDIHGYLPFVPAFESPITILHLMNHTSGLREIYNTEAIRGRRSGDAMYQEDVIRMVERQRSLNFSPGSQFMYCNTAYALLAEIIEVVSGQRFEDWMYEHIFAPLGMYHTFIMDRQGEIFPKMASSYSLQADSVYTQLFDNNTVRGQGGIYSCLEDMMKWVGHLATLKEQRSLAMQKLVEPGVLSNGDTIPYAKGLYVESFRGIQRIFHSGSSAGYRSGLVYFPEYDLGLFVNVNAPDVPLYETLDMITSFFLENEMEDLVPENTKTTETKSKEFLSFGEIDPQWEGTYYCTELETTYHLFLQKGKLMGRHFRHGTFALEQEGEDRFRSNQYFFPKIQFERNLQDRITGLRLTTGRAKNIYFKKQGNGSGE